ncbi:hypothetical protein PG985_001679 [Apiospora marii]|uniref:uncharacterized protein n=1 Tax=Apiospora marii TaxID=335849 RepID=UPI0031300C0D
MDSIQNHPELSRRRYGKHDFERFDHLISQQAGASLGSSTIGKASVDCRFLFQKSQWGVLGPMKNPAGIIYLDLTIHQPKDCRLKSATITVTLDDDDDELAEPGPETNSMQPVQIGSYGPKQLHGQPRRVIRTKKHNLTPQFEVGGMAGFGGIGLDSEEHSVRESRWSFHTQVSPNPKKSGKHSWVLRVLKWELEENELDSQPIHSNTIHTAFSFEHGGQPFLMKVEVAGRLESTRSDLKNRLKCKFPANSKKNKAATTLINFGGRGRFNKPLDEIAKGLPLVMELENLNSVPVELPDPQVPSFYQESQTSDRFHHLPLETYKSRDEHVAGHFLHAGINHSTLRILDSSFRHQTRDQGQTDFELANYQEVAGAKPSSVTADLDALSNTFVALAGADLSPLEGRSNPTKKAQTTDDNREQHQALMESGASVLLEAQSPGIETSSATAVDYGGDYRKRPSTRNARLHHPQQEIAQETVLILLRIFGIMRLLELFLAMAARIGVDLTPLRHRLDKSEDLRSPDPLLSRAVAGSARPQKTSRARYRRGVHSRV